MKDLKDRNLTESDRFLIYGSEHPGYPSKAHIYDDKKDGALCGANGFWMEWTAWFVVDLDSMEVFNVEAVGLGKKVHEKSLLPFNQYIDCKKCQKAFKKIYPLIQL